jgi:transglutaminase-like putative cysteine protease
MVSQLDFETKGVQTAVFEAEDIYGNITTAEAEFIVSTDTVPPVFSGLTTLQVQKNSTPNYTIGVSAKDAIDGACKIRYDASSVDTSKPGTYYVTYYATDKSNNTATARRKVEVLHDAADTDALVKELAPKLSSDPEALRDYVRSTISYSTNWGGSDPVWFGFKNKHGNCYVHAMCLDVLLKYNGYSTQLIWTTCKTHYWLLINIGGTWRHIDPTPSSLHGRYSLMTDAQRLSTLSGRNWDRDAWPACE